MDAEEATRADRTPVNFRMAAAGVAWLDQEADRLSRQDGVFTHRVSRADVIRAALRMWAALPVGSRKL